MLKCSNIFDEIRILREKLYSNIEDEGLCSEKTLSLSREVDNLILEFYRSPDITKALEP